MKRLVIAEGIDFIEYYARSMMDLADGKPVLDREGNITNISINQLVQALQSHLELSICNYGWYNFSSCCRYTVLLKPAEDTVTAYKLIEI